MVVSTTVNMWYTSVLVALSMFCVNCMGLQQNDSPQKQNVVGVHRRQNCNDSEITNFFGPASDGTIDGSRSLTCQELLLKNSCGHPEFGSIVRYQCPVTCGAECTDEVPDELLEASRLSSSGGGFGATYIIIIVLLVIILVVVIVLFIRAGRRGNEVDFMATTHGVDMTIGKQHRRGSSLYTIENETIMLDSMNAVSQDHDVVFGNTRTQESVQETSLTTAPVDFNALSDIKDSYITDSKLHELKAGFDHFVSTIYDDEEFDIENDAAIEAVITECFNEAQLSLMVEYDDLLEHLDVEDLNSTLQSPRKDTPGATSPAIGRIRANSVTSLDIPDTKIHVRDFLARVVEALRRDNLYNPERTRFWKDFTPLLKDYVIELKKNDERLEVWRAARSVQYHELFEQFFKDGYCDSEPSIDSLVEHVSETIEEALAEEDTTMGDGVATLRRKSATTAMRTNRWKNSSFWVHVRLMLDREGIGHVQMKSFLVYLTEECLDNIIGVALEGDDKPPGRDVPDLPVRRGPSLSLDGLFSPTNEEGESSADGAPEQHIANGAEDTATETAGKESPGKVRKLARMRSVAPPPDEEPDLLHPTRVDLATGQRQPSINENQRIIRLVASLKKYLGMLQWATVESDEGMLPQDAADEYIPQCFNDLQQNFRVKITDLEEKLGFIYSDTSTDSDGQILSIWTKWAWSSFWVKVKLDLDTDGDGRVKVHTFLEFLTDKIRSAHKTAVTRHDGSFNRKLARSGSIIYMSSTDVEAQEAARAAMEQASARSKTNKQRRQERLKLSTADDKNPTYIDSHKVKDSKKKSREHSGGRDKKRGKEMAVVNDLYDNADSGNFVGDYATVQHDGMGRTSSASSFAESASMESKTLTPRRRSQEQIYQMPQDAQQRLDEYLIVEDGLYGDPQDAPQRARVGADYNEPQDATTAYTEVHHPNAHGDHYSQPQDSGEANNASVENDSIRSDAIVVGGPGANNGYRQAIDSNPKYREAVLSGATANDEPAYSTVHVMPAGPMNASMRRNSQTEDDFVAYTDVNVVATMLYNQQQREQEGAMQIVNEGYDDDDDGANDHEA